MIASGSPGWAQPLHCLPTRLTYSTGLQARCRALPLSVWDAEENFQAFSAADRAAQIWFLVAFHAVAALKQIDRAVDPASVRALAEAVWNHCYFSGQHLADERDASIASETAARFAIEFGEPNDVMAAGTGA